MELARSGESLHIRGGREEEEHQVRLIEWEQPQEQRQKQQESIVEDGIVYVKVMTDEQMELLRKQISIYATICERLVEMHKALTAQQDFTGMRLGNVLYCDPLTTTCMGQKISSRQRWNPTPMQLQILEHIFDQGTGTPSKQKIKDVTNEVSQHGPISETNVYNWFQNRRARSKRKQHGGNGPNNAESEEVETEVESPREKRAKPENIIQSNGQSSEPQPDKGEPAISCDGCSKSSGLGDEVSFYDTVLSTPRIDHLIPGSSYYTTCRHGEDYE